VSWPGGRSRDHGRAVSHASDDELHAARHTALARSELGGPARHAFEAEMKEREQRA
jgi:hypothetical protein